VGLLSFGSLAIRQPKKTTEQIKVANKMTIAFLLQKNFILGGSKRLI
jgi:hypothetical protein